TTGSVVLHESTNVGVVKAAVLTRVRSGFTPRNGRVVAPVVRVPLAVPDSLPVKAEMDVTSTVVREAHMVVEVTPCHAVGRRVIVQCAQARSPPARECVLLVGGIHIQRVRV